MAVLKSAAQQQLDPTVYIIVEVVEDIVQSKLIMLHMDGYTTLKSLFDLLVDCEGDMTRYYIEINGKKYFPFDSHDSDKVERFLSRHPSTKAEFEATFDMQPVQQQTNVAQSQVAVSNQNGQTVQQAWETTLRTTLNRVSSLLDPQGTAHMQQNGKKQ